MAESETISFRIPLKVFEQCARWAREQAKKVEHLDLTYKPSVHSEAKTLFMQAFDHRQEEIKQLKKKKKTHRRISKLRKKKRTKNKTKTRRRIHQKTNRT